MICVCTEFKVVFCLYYHKTPYHGGDSYHISRYYLCLPGPTTVLAIFEVFFIPSQYSFYNFNATLTCFCAKRFSFFTPIISLFWFQNEHCDHQRISNRNLNLLENALLMKHTVMLLHTVLIFNVKKNKK